MCFGTYNGANDSYVGEWKNGKFHGQGMLSAADGSSQTGEFEDGVFQKGDYKQPDPRITALNQAPVAQQQLAPQQNPNVPLAQGFIAEAHQWTANSKAAVYRSLLTTDSRSGLSPYEDKTIRDHIMNAFGTHTKGQYGDIEQKKIHAVNYLGRNRYPNKYNNFVYETYFISTQVFILGPQGNLKKSTLYSIELDAIFVEGGNFDYKWTWTSK
jgi:hypothetical protein